jgi:hypothetical protein
VYLVATCVGLAASATYFARWKLFAIEPSKSFTSWVAFTMLCAALLTILAGGLYQHTLKGYSPLELGGNDDDDDDE